MPEKQAGLPSPSGRGRWVSRRFLPAQADPAQRSLSISHQRPHLPVLLLCRDLAAGSLGTAWGVTRSLLRVFHFKGKRRTRRRGGEAAGAESDCPFRLCGGGMSATVKPLEDQELFLKGETRLLRIRERADSREKDTRRSASWFPRDTCCQRLRLHCLRRKDNLKSPRARMLPAGR